MERYHVALFLLFGVLWLLSYFRVLPTQTEEPVGVFSAVAVVLLAVAFLIGPYWYAYKMYREALEDRHSAPAPPPQPLVDDAPLQKAMTERDALARQLKDIYDTCRQIFYLGGGAATATAVLEEEILIVIDKDGTARFSKKTTYQVVDPIKHLLETVFGDAPVSLVDVDFKAQAEGGHKLRILPTQDEMQQKTYLLFFLPEVTPTDSPVTCITQWRWPRIFRQLAQRQEDFWKWTAKGPSAVPRIRFRFRLHSDLPEIHLHNTYDQGHEVAGSPDESGYREFIWEMTDVNTMNPIEIRLKPR